MEFISATCFCLFVVYSKIISCRKIEKTGKILYHYLNHGGRRESDNERFFDSVDKLPTCIKEYKKTSPFYIKDCRSCIAYRICGGSCVFDKLTRFGRTDIKDECRCGLTRMIAEKSLEIVLNSISNTEKCRVISQEERNNIIDKLERSLI